MGFFSAKNRKYLPIVYLLSFVFGTGFFALTRHDVFGIEPEMVEVDAFREANSLERERMILKFSNFHDKRVMNLFLLGLKDPDPSVRYAAAWALGGVEGSLSQFPAVVKALVESIGDEDPWIKTQVIKSLAFLKDLKVKLPPGLNESLRELLLKHAKDRDPFIRSEVIRTLSFWRDHPKVQEVLKEAFNDNVPLTRYASFWAGYGDNDRIPAAAFRDEDLTIRSRAIGLLQRHGYGSDPQLRDLAIERLRDESDIVIHDALVLLMQSKEKHAVRPILDLINIGWEKQTERAITEITNSPLSEVLSEFGWKPNPDFKRDAPIRRAEPAQVKKLTADLKRGDRFDQMTAALQLTWVKEESVMRSLAELLDDPDPRIRYTALMIYQTASQYRFDEIAQFFDRLVLTLEDPDPHVQREAIQLVSDLISKGDFLNKLKKTDFVVTEEAKERIISFLTQAINKPVHPFVREISIRSLLNVKGSQASQNILVKLLEDDLPMIRKAAITGTFIGCYPEALQPVLKTLRDPDPFIRRIAVQKLQAADVENQQVLEMLKQVIKSDTDQSVRNQAKQSLQQLEWRRNDLSKRVVHDCVS